MKIAIIEDDQDLSLNIWKKLRKNWYETIISNSFDDFKKYILDCADLYIIDLNLWNNSWFEIIEWLRVEKNCNKPILIMSCYDDIDNKLKWFNLWADDYICKPIIPNELLARVTALLRRWTSISKTTVSYKDFVFNFESKEIFKGNRKIQLTRKELQIIEYFLLNIGKVVYKDKLIKSIWWNFDLLDVTYNTINVTICNIRRKIWFEFDIETVIWIWYILKKY